MLATPVLSRLKGRQHASLAQRGHLATRRRASVRRARRAQLAAQVRVLAMPAKQDTLLRKLRLSVNLVRRVPSAAPRPVSVYHAPWASTATETDIRMIGGNVTVL